MQALPKQWQNNGTSMSDYFIYGKAGGPLQDEDPIVQQVIDRVHRRSQEGMKKYGVTMERPDVTTVEWLRHAQEEALDLAVYLERIIRDMSNG
jgi:hypothetical protein